MTRGDAFIVREPLWAESLHRRKIIVRRGTLLVHLGPAEVYRTGARREAAAYAMPGVGIVEVTHFYRGSVFMETLS